MATNVLRSWVDGLFFVVAPGGKRDLVIPRRFRLVLRPGSGALAFPGSPPLAPEWRASVGFAWSAACRAAGRSDVDGVLEIPGNVALTGGSAGLPVGLVALALLRDDPPPTVASTGCVTDVEGRLEGGSATEVKARAAADVARERPVLFLTPLREPPRVEGVEIVGVPDLASAYAFTRARAARRS